MNNGCPKCEKLPSGILCPMCEIGMLQCTVKAALADYVDKVNEILKGKKDEDSDGQTRMRQRR